MTPLKHLKTPTPEGQAVREINGQHVTVQGLQGPGNMSRHHLERRDGSAEAAKGSWPERCVGRIRANGCFEDEPTHASAAHKQKNKGLSNASSKNTCIHRRLCIRTLNCMHERANPKPHEVHPRRSK